MEDNYIEPKITSFNFKKYLSLLLSNWYWFIIALSICYSFAYLINRYTEPVFSVSSTMLIEEESASPTSVENIIRDLGFYKRQRKREILNEIEILKSYDLNYRTLNELEFGITYAMVGRRGISEIKLYKNSPFIVKIDSSKYNRAGLPVYITVLSPTEYLMEYDGENAFLQTYSFGESIESKYFNLTINLKDPEEFKNIERLSNKYYFIINDLTRLANSYRSKLTVTLNDEKGSVLLLTSKGYNKQQEVDYLNQLGKVYIRAELEEKNKIAENSIVFIEEQLKSISDSLIIDEEKLQDFRLKNKIIGISEEAEKLIEIQKNLQTEKVKVLIEQNYYEYLNEYINSNEINVDLILPTIPSITTADLQKLIDRLNELYINKKLLRLSATENNIVFENLETEIDNIKILVREIIKENSKLMSDRLNEINVREKDLSNNIIYLPTLEREYLNIERRFSLYNNLYNFLLQKRAEAGIAKASNISSRSIIDNARIENAIQLSPNRRVNKLGAISLGLIIPLVFILIISLLKNKIDDLQEINELTKVPVIAVIGHNSEKQELPIVVENPKSYITESFRSLRTNLKYLIKEKNNLTITITSTVSGEGKTFCATNLAAILAMAKYKTLLIELDLRRPSLHKQFNINKDLGLSNYLAGLNNFNEVVHKTQIEYLYVAPGGTIPPNPSELIESQLITDFFNYAKSDFQFIIIDTPPIAFVSDAIQLSKFSDAYFFVIRHNYSNKNILNYIDKLYSDKKLKQINLLINDVRIKNLYDYSYYGYPYTYAYSLGYYNKYYEPEKLQNGTLGKILSRIRKK